MVILFGKHAIDMIESSAENRYIYNNEHEIDDVENSNDITSSSDDDESDDDSDDDGADDDDDDDDDTPIQEFEDDNPRNYYKDREPWDEDWEDEGWADQMWNEESLHPEISVGDYNIDCFDASRGNQDYIQKYGISSIENPYFNELYDEHYDFIMRKRQKVD
jgi:hypothetical protein